VVANKPMHGPNQWPSLTGFRGALETYYDAVDALDQSLLPGMAQALDLPADFFAPFHRRLSRGGSCVIRRRPKARASSAPRHTRISVR
jgi:isopenicillin N synthase-like dioxygenase